jgi:hypothetical protein
MIEVRSEKRGNHLCTEEKKKNPETNVTENPNSQTATNIRSEKRIFIPKQTCRCPPPNPHSKKRNGMGII